LILTTGLEDAYSKTRFTKVHKILQRNWPFIIASNPVNWVSRPVAIIERHVKDDRTDAYSNDGEYLTPDEFAMNAHGKRYAFYWWNAQGITKKFIEPRKRVIIIRDSDIEAVNLMLRRH